MTDIERQITSHYNNLVLEGHDPFLDPPEMRVFMDEWDGPEFIAMPELSGREKVLEIGCGTSRTAGMIMADCAEYTGIDISPVSIKRAEINLADIPGTPHRKFLCGAFPSYPIEGKYDVIFSTLTFLHIQDKRAAMTVLASLLNPRGRIVLSLDKARKEDIEYCGRTVPVFPG